MAQTTVEPRERQPSSNGASGDGPAWQTLTVDEALRIATINGAYASYEEKTKGSITAGKLADFVMLEKDPHEVDPNTIKDIRIARTVVGGKTMYPKTEV